MDKKINWYLVSTYGFRKTKKYQTLIDVKKLTFSKFLYPYGWMLPFAIIKPFGNGELFSQKRAHFCYLQADRTTSTPENNGLLSDF
jgi:hypothetical protein